MGGREEKSDPQRRKGRGRRAENGGVGQENAEGGVERIKAIEDRAAAMENGDAGRNWESKGREENEGSKQTTNDPRNAQKGWEGTGRDEKERTGSNRTGAWRVRQGTSNAVQASRSLPGHANTQKRKTKNEN